MTAESGAAKGKIRSYKDLLVWQKAMTLVKEVYLLTAKFPADERFGLTAQMRQAAVSVPSNIAEGHARQGAKEYPQFLSHAGGSLAELETQALLAINLNHCKHGDAEGMLSLIEEVQRMLAGLRRSLAG
jgi:four helix bundle protein